MQTMKFAQPAATGLRPRNTPTGFKGSQLSHVVAPRRQFIARAEPQQQVEDAAEKAADTVTDKTKEAAQAVEQKVPSSGSFGDRVDAAGREISQFTQETSGLNQDNTTIKKSQDGKPAFEEAMSFSGQVPERANSRLAMLAFAAAAGAELATGSPVASQIQKSPVLIAGTFLLFIIASIIPILRGEDPNKQSGPFTVRAELWNGRLAMLGFIALLLTETLRKGPAL